MLTLAVQLILAEATTVTLLVATLALSALAYALRPRPKNAAKADDTPTTLTTRGSWLQSITGVRRVAPVFAWRGDRAIRQESSGGGKGGGGGSSFDIYYESAWHLLAIGPCAGLLAIEENGKVIFNTPITRSNTPSGTTLTTISGDQFRIYWGDRNQPVNTYLGASSRIGISSAWPYFCYVLWIGKRVGESPRWGQIEYVLDGGATGSVLGRTPPEMQATDVNANNSGPNPAHVVYRHVLGQGPHGAGVNPAWVDTASLESLGELFQRERTPCSVHVQSGRSVGEALAELAQDFGFGMVQVGHKLAFLPIRRDTTVPLFTAAHLIDTFPTIDTPQVPTAKTRTIYLTPDRTQRFKPIDPLLVRDDAASRMFLGQNVEEVTLATVVDRRTGALVAKRRAAESTVQAAVTQLRMSYDARALVPGQAFELEGYGRFRVASVGFSTDSSDVLLGCVPDQYGDPLVFDPGTQNTLPAPEAPVADRYVAAFELPFSLVRDRIALGIARIRNNGSVGSAYIWLSLNNVSYTQVLLQPRYASGGLLQYEIPVDTDEVLEGSAAPFILSPNNDILEVAQDLSGDEGAWLSGQQLALIDDELFYVRNPDVEGLGYRLHGAIRAKGGTVRQRHTPGALVYVFSVGDLTAVFHGYLTPGATVWVKVQPRGVPLDQITPVRLTIKGWARAPLPPANVGPERYMTGANWVGVWHHRVRDGLGAAAGEQTYGQVLQSTQYPQEGTFSVRILDPVSRAEKRHVDVATPTFTYTPAMRQADFGTQNPDSFIVQVSNDIGAYASRRTERTIRRD